MKTSKNLASLSQRNRGSALIMGIIVSVVVTSLVMIIAWTSTTMIQSSSSLMKENRALSVAEGALQRAYWRYKYDYTFRADPSGSPATAAITGSDVVDGQTYSYSVTVVGASVTAPVLITSTASTGSVQAQVHVTVISAAASLPAFSSGGDFDGKNIIITGNIQVGGNFSESGSGSVNGNLIYGGTATGTNNVSGTHTQGSFTAINFTTMGTSLQSNAGLTYNGAQSNKTFDFTSVPGTNKVIYVNGNVTNPTFIGTGTLYVNGTISTGGFGTASNPVDLVATGDITTSNNITMYGGIYTGGNWNRGKMNLTGTVYVAGISASNNGQSDLTDTASPTSAPWFDPRAQGVTPTNYGGAAP